MKSLPGRPAWLAVGFALSLTARSHAQPSSASFPDPQPPAPAPAAPPSAAPAPTAPASAAPAPAVPAPAPAPTATTPAPAPAPPPAPPPAYPQSQYYEPLPPPRPPAPPPEGEGFKMPPWSVRIDPFIWLFDGKLGLELEVGLLKFLSFELVPIFVTSEQPPTFDIFDGWDDTLYRESNGFGPLAGTSVGFGFWLGKKPLEGSVLRVILTNYSYHYKAKDNAGEFDDVPHVERRLFGYFGSHSTYGAFTLAGGFGLGVELNKETRCILDQPGFPASTTRCPDDDDLLIKTDRFMRTPPIDLNGGYGGVQILFRISLGVTFN